MDDGRRVEVVQVRCSTAEKQAWGVRAAGLGVSVSELVRLKMNEVVVGGLGAGEVPAVAAAGREGRAGRVAPEAVSRPAPAPSPRPFRPDPKK